MRRRRPAVLALAVALSLVVAGCTGGGGRADGGGPEPATRRAGGSVTVAVWADPDPDDPGLGGAAVRDLTLPQLFEATPTGGWRESLVAPGSVRTAPDHTSASFRLREGASWSDGAPITADDLRRSADQRFVAGVDGPDAAGGVTVRFTGPLPGWRRLWSATASITPPRPGVSGGPFRVERVTRGLETVLHRNERWYGDRVLLDEVRLVLVPDAVTARQLLEAGSVDVVAPLPYTVRTSQLEAVDGARVVTSPASSWWTAVLVNRRVPVDVRRAVAATVDRDRFVQTLLTGEAVPVRDLGVTDADGGPPASGTPWPAVVAGDQQGLDGRTLELTVAEEEPMAGLLARSMQKRAIAVDGVLELRSAELRRVEGWLSEGSYDVAVVPLFDGPEPCWRCRWESALPAQAAAADAGAAGAVGALQQALRDEALVVPLWRGAAVVAARERVVGVTANGFAVSAAAGAPSWSVRS